MNTFKTKAAKKFLIITRGRTGSNFLLSLFDSHPYISHYSEIVGPWRLRNKEGFKEELNTLGSEVFLKQSFEPVGKELAVGMKFHYHHFDKAYAIRWGLPDLYKALDYFVSDRDIKIIHLKRRNILKTLVSLRVSDKTKQYVLRNESERINDIRIKLEVEDCMREFEKTSDNENRFDAMFRDHDLLEVAYEDLVAEQTQTCNRIQEFLQIPKHSLNCKTFKQIKRPVAEVVENYEELKTVFSNTPWRKFFDE